MRQDEPIYKHSDIIQDRLQNSWTDHLEEWLYGPLNMGEFFTVWMQETKYTLEDIAPFEHPSEPLHIQLIRAWWKEQPTYEALFWEYATEEEYDKLNEE